MRCTNCDYPLWNIPSRACPECGQPFKPSDFTFHPNAVRFQCPHCEQEYYGTNENGHLVPAAFDCVNCHNHIHMDETVVVPAEGVAERDTQQKRPLPWIDKRRKSWRSAFWTTVGLSLGAPASLAKRLPDKPKPAAALGFAAAMTAVPIAVAALLTAAIGIILGFTGGLTGGFTGIVPVSFILFAILPIVVTALAHTLVHAPIQHAALAITGGTKRGFAATIECAGFSAAPLLLTLIPCLGSYLLPLTILWWSISNIFLLKHRQATGWTRAILIGLLPAALSTAAIAAIIYALVSPFTTNWPSSSFTTAAATSSNLTQWASTHDGTGPDNALIMLTDGTALADEFTAPGLRATAGVNQSPPFTIAGHTLEDLELPSQTQRNTALQSLDATRPQNPAAQRIGDVLFTHFAVAIDPQALPPNATAAIEQSPGDLWWAIIYPEPNTFRPPDPSDEVFIISSVTFEQTDYATLTATELPAQNTLRATFNLPPIPDPATVPHAHWVAADGSIIPPKPATPPQPAGP